MSQSLTNACYGKAISSMKLGESMSFPSILPGVTDTNVIGTVKSMHGLYVKQLNLTWHGIYIGSVECSDRGEGKYNFTVMD